MRLCVPTQDQLLPSPSALILHPRASLSGVGWLHSGCPLSFAGAGHTTGLSGSVLPSRMTWQSTGRTATRGHEPFYLGKVSQEDGVIRAPKRHLINAPF